jgi:hypothetical protein
MSLFALALTALSVMPRITSAPAVTCPSEAGLRAALVGLLPERTPASPSGTSVVLRPVPDGAGGALLVQIHDDQGKLLVERRLRPWIVADSACPQRTQEVAVVIAAAVGQPRGPGALTAPEVSLESEPPAPPAPPRAPKPPAVQPAPPPAPPPPPPPATRAVAPAPAPPQPALARADVAVQARPAVAGPSPMRFAVGLALGGSLSGGTLAPGAAADLTLRVRSRLLLAVGGLYVADHSMPLGPGDVVWSRFGVVASLAYTMPLGPRWFVEAGAGAGATALHLEGRDVPSATSSSTFDPGASVLLRFGHRGDRTELWIGATLWRWLRPQGAFLRGTGDAVDLSRWEVNLGLGGRFGVTFGRVAT